MGNESTGTLSGKALRRQLAQINGIIRRRRSGNFKAKGSTASASIKAKFKRRKK